MRKDFGKCVTEIPRSGSRNRNVKIKRFGKFVVVDGELDYEGITRIPVSWKAAILAYGDHKEFGDKLGPILNFLKSSCGRLWNDVHSELSQTLGNAPWPVQHILKDHINVAVNTYRGVDDNVYVCGKYGVEKAAGYGYPFYVEPETGILREFKSKRTYRQIERSRKVSERKKIAETFVEIEGLRSYQKLKGIWYYAESELIDYQGPSIDMRSRYYRRQSIQRDAVIVRKRQLGRKQLLKLGLKNG